MDFQFLLVNLFTINCISTKPESPTKTRPTIAVTQMTT